MTPQELELFEGIIKDLDFFIAGFRRQLDGPNGDRFAEPLAKLEQIRDHIQLLHKGTRKLSRKLTESRVPLMLEKLQDENKENFRVFRADFKAMAALTSRIEPNVERLEVLEKRILSLSQVSMEAAGKLRDLLKDVTRVLTNQSTKLNVGSGSDSSLTSAVDETAETVEKIEDKINALARGLTKIGREVGQMPERLDTQSSLFEVRLATLESKLQGFLERNNFNKALEQLNEKWEPRLRNSEDGLKLVLNESRYLGGLIKKSNHTQLTKMDPRFQKSYDRLDIIIEAQKQLTEQLDTIEARTRALEEQKQQETPTAEEGGEAPKQASAADPQLAEDVQAMKKKLDGFEEILLKISNRQSAIESLSMVLHPLSVSLQDLTRNYDTQTSLLDEKVEAISKQVSALQAIVRNTYRQTSKALTGQFSRKAFKDAIENDEQPFPKAPDEDEAKAPISEDDTPKEPVEDEATAKA